MASAALSPRARRDLLEAKQWIAKDNRATAEGLRHAVVDAAQRIGAHPLIGVLRPEWADEPVRFLALTGLPYLIVYDASRDPPLILRVLHGARDMPTVLGGS